MTCAARLESGAGITAQATMQLRVIRDDNIIAAFSADFRKPDRLQQAWLGSDGSVEWRDVEVIPESKACPAQLP